MKSISDCIVRKIPSAHIEHWPVVGLALFCFFQFFWGLGTIPFYTRGESREGLVVWEMFNTANWILPRINGDYIPFKPPLFHWIGASVSLVIGDVSELSIRFPSALLATLGVLLVYVVGSRLWNRKVGLIAAMVLATNQEWWQTGVMAQVDMVLAVLMTAALLLFYFMYRSGEASAVKSFMGGALLALATLAKGPLGIVLPLLVIIVFLALRHDLQYLKTVPSFSAAAAFLVIAGFWYGLAYRQGGSAFFVRQILEESFGTAGGNYGHHQPVYYFIPVFFLNFAPWSFFSPFIGIFLYRRRRELSGNDLLFPLVWVITVLLFFSFAAGKRGVYILPLYPAFTVLFGVWWESLEREPLHTDRRLVSAISYVLGSATLIAAARILFLLLASSDLRNERLFPFIRNPSTLAANVTGFLAPPAGWVWLCLMIFTVAGLVTLLSLPRHKWRGVLVGLLLISIASTMYLKTVYYPAVAAQRTMKSFAIRLRQNAHSETPLAFYQAFDYGTIFYSRRHIPEEPPKRSERNKPLFLLVWEEDLQSLREHGDLQIVDVSEGRGPVDKHHLVLVKSSTVMPLPRELRKSPQRNDADGTEPPA